MRAPARIAGLYALFGALWILLSDLLLESLAGNPAIALQLQTIKGWFFIAITGILLFLLVKHQLANMQRSNDELERHAAERTERLESVNRELEAFSYTISHDLKAPLRGIDGFGFLLLNQYGDAIPEGARHLVEKMREATAHMNRLIEDLLAYSRIERRELYLRQISLIRILDQLQNEKALEIEQSHATIDLDLHCDTVLADPDGLMLVFRNLLDNALKFASEQPPRIRIASFPKGDRCQIRFSDNGIGFAPEYAEQIFKIFHRLHTQDRYPGTGIGLAIVRKAMTRMCGDVRAEGRLGEGATFLLELSR